MRDERRQRLLVGNDVDQSSAEHQGGADGKHFQSIGEQYAAPQINLLVDVVGNLQIICDCIQKLIYLPLWSEQSIAFQEIKYIVLRFMSPLALSFERRAVPLCCFVFYRFCGFYEQSVQFLFPRALLYLVSP